MVDGQLLGDHATDRPSGHVGAFDVERVEDGDGVIGHVGEAVGHLRLRAVFDRVENGEEIG